MSIGPVSTGFSLFPNGTSALAPSPSKPKNATQNSTDPKDIIAEIASGGSTGLIKYQEQQIEDKARADVLKSLGLTEDGLKSLSPEKKSAVEDAIAKAIKDALKNALQGDGKTPAAKANADSDKPPATPNNQSLISSSTWSALFDA